MGSKGGWLFVFMRRKGLPLMNIGKTKIRIALQAMRAFLLQSPPGTGITLMQ